MALEENSVSTLNDIDERRKLLQEVFATARAIEDLQDSLNSVLILGDKATPLPDTAYDFFTNLSDKIRNQPTDHIQNFYQKLQGMISDQIEQILELSRLDEDDDGDIPFEEESLQLLTRFKRMAQTAVALRILLKQRGVPVKGEALSVPVEEIKSQLTDLDLKEQRQRKKIRKQIIEMQDELKLMIGADHFSDEIKQTMAQALAGLEVDLKAIDSGKKIESLNLSFEAVQSEDKLHTEHSLQEEQLEKKRLLDESLEAEENLSFVEKTKRWLDSPWNVSWKQISKDKKS